MQCVDSPVRATAALLSPSSLSLSLARPKANGNILTPYLDPRTADEVAAAGGIVAAARDSDGVAEIKPDGKTGGTVVWQWRFWDHLVQSADPAGPNYVADGDDHGPG